MKIANLKKKLNQFHGKLRKKSRSLSFLFQGATIHQFLLHKRNISSGISDLLAKWKMTQMAFWTD